MLAEKQRSNGGKGFVGNRPREELAAEQQPRTSAFAGLPQPRRCAETTQPPGGRTTPDASLLKGEVPRAGLGQRLL